MADEAVLSLETFLKIAETSGLDVNDQPHMDELYAFLQTLIPTLRKVRKLGVADAEPAPSWVPAEE